MDRVFLRGHQRKICMTLDFNISYGAQMLAGLIQKYGNIRDALMKYGPMNMGYNYADIILNIMNNYR